MKIRKLAVTFVTIFVLLVLPLFGPANVYASRTVFQDEAPTRLVPTLNPEAALQLLDITPANPIELAQAMGVPSANIVDASLLSSDPLGAMLANSPIGRYFPSEGNTFVILSTGLATYADDPNTNGYLGYDLGGMSNSQGHDMVQFYLKLHVPPNMNCASFDFAYYSEEFPEWVGSFFNDAFTAEAGGTKLTIENNQVTSPLNFALDTENNIISVNTVLGVQSDTLSTYDGGTNLLRAQKGVTPNTDVEFYFTVQDLGDSVYDSAVFVDKFFWSNDSNCGGEVVEDSDGDGLLDTWEADGLTVEIDGTEVLVDLPAMGANPQKKDVFVEIDYMKDNGNCVPVIGCIFGHNHVPKDGAIQKIITAFANAPVPNPDGTNGIVLHVDYGADSVMNPLTGAKWGELSQSNILPHDTELGSFNQNGSVYYWNEFDALKQKNFTKAREAVFHYCIFAHNLGGLGYSGVSRDITASDFIVTLGGTWGSEGSENEQAGTFMHELGHNLGLRHGGDDDGNYEPNYLSVMNYSFQFRGVRINGQDGSFDYSRFALPPLNENHLDETVGINGGQIAKSYGVRYYCPNGSNKVVDPDGGAINWDCDGASDDTDVSVNINKEGGNTTLNGYNDWANLVFTGGALGQPGAVIELPSETVQDEITIEEDAQIITDYRVGMTSPPSRYVLPAAVVEYTFTVQNLGIVTDTYSLSVQSSNGWITTSDVPASVTLLAGEQQSFHVTIQTPGVSSFPVDKLTLTATSQSKPAVTDTAQATTSLLNQSFLPMLRR